jgi:hypothetical protein
VNRFESQLHRLLFGQRVTGLRIVLARVPRTQTLKELAVDLNLGRCRHGK